MYNRYTSSAMLQLIKGYKAYHFWANYGSDCRGFTIQDFVEPMEEIPNLNKTIGPWMKTFRSEEEFRETANSIINIINVLHNETPNMQIELVKGLVDLISKQDNAEQVFQDLSYNNKGLNFSSWEEFSNFIYDLMKEMEVELGPVQKASNRYVPQAIKILAMFYLKERDVNHMQDPVTALNYISRKGTFLFLAPYGRTETDREREFRTKFNDQMLSIFRYPAECPLAKLNEQCDRILELESLTTKYGLCDDFRPSSMLDKHFKDIQEIDSRLQAFASWSDFAKYLRWNTVPMVTRNVFRYANGGKNKSDKCLQLAEKCMELSSECMKMAQELRNQP